jgi:hypothetical protein
MDKNVRRRFRYREKQLLPPIRRDTVLREALSVRLHMIGTAVDEKPCDIEALAEVAALVSKIEKLVTISYERPNPLYDLDDGRFRCRFSTCHKRKSCKEVYDFNEHLKKSHPFLTSALEHKRCLTCGEIFTSTSPLIFHERHRHQCTYKSRAELTLPYFADFQSECQIV